MFKLDPEEKQYENGKFQLNDGTVVNADYLMYAENHLFAFGIAIFSEGNLAKIQLETDKSIEDITKGLGLNLNGGKVEQNKFGYEIIFNETFHDSNIAKFPNEWD